MRIINLRKNIKEKIVIFDIELEGVVLIQDVIFCEGVFKVPMLEVPDTNEIYSAILFHNKDKFKKLLSQEMKNKKLQELGGIIK